jgi:hypothetical protein
VLGKCDDFERCAVRTKEFIVFLMNHQHWTLVMSVSDPEMPYFNNDAIYTSVRN